MYVNVVRGISRNKGLLLAFRVSHCFLFSFNRISSIRVRLVMPFTRDYV